MFMRAKLSDETDFTLKIYQNHKILELQFD